MVLWRWLKAGSLRQVVQSSKEVSTGSRRTSNPSSLYCSAISDRRGSLMVNRFSQPSFFSSSSLVIDYVSIEVRGWRP